MENTALKFFEKADAPVGLQEIEACHRLKSDDNDRYNKVIMKFCKSNGMVREKNKKRSIKFLTKVVQVSLTLST